MAEQEIKISECGENSHIIEDLLQSQLSSLKNNIIDNKALNTEMENYQQENEYY